MTVCHKYCGIGVIWKHEDINVRDNTVFQDIQCPMLLEKAGRGACSSKHTLHTNILVFFVRYRTNNGEIQVEYCPTNLMIANLFTKIIQGS